MPFLGDSVFLSSGLKFNIELVLFKSPWAPFNQWHLREDFKRVAKRKELADSLRTHILVLGCVNLVLMPVILLWQILYSFFNYAEVIKREPGSLGVRKWSLYARYYLRWEQKFCLLNPLFLRHFNELEHELSARLSRAYKPATHYMDIFVRSFSLRPMSCHNFLIVPTELQHDTINWAEIYSFFLSLTNTMMSRQCGCKKVCTELKV